MKLKDIKIGSKWKNKRSGTVSTIVAIDAYANEVLFRHGRTGMRRKYFPHLLTDYELVEEAAS